MLDRDFIASGPVRDNAKQMQRFAIVPVLGECGAAMVFRRRQIAGLEACQCGGKSGAIVGHKVYHKGNQP
jgi:hypothetical protein